MQQQWPPPFKELCTEHELLITNTVFCLPTRNKTSGMHPPSKHWNLIDYVILQRKDRQNVRVTKTMCGADCWTVSHKHQDWFDENDKEIQGLLEEKHQKHKADLSDTSSVPSKTAYTNICKPVQSKLRNLQDSWLSKKADEIQSFADRKDMKQFFDTLKTVYGPQSPGTTPFFSADGTSLLTDKEANLKRWAEHFDGVLNRPSFVNDEAINRLPQVEYNPLLDEFPVISETVKAIKLLSSGKAPGSDTIPAEIYKAGGPPVAEKLTELFHMEKRNHLSRI